MSPSSPPIAKLAPELLVMIFKCISQELDQTATLASVARCCRAWYPLAQSALYGDVALRDQRLIRFAGQPGCADGQIRSLTLRMDRIPVNPYDPSQAQKVERERLEALHQIELRMPQMGSLTSFSICAYFLTAYPTLDAVSRIIDSLPAGVASLEIDIMASLAIDTTASVGLEAGATRHVHVCPLVRKVLPRLRYLRLRLPWICPALCATPVQTGALDREKEFESAHAPLLEDCIINVSLREPGRYSCGAWTTTCMSPDDPLPSSSAAHVLRSTSPAGMLFALEEFCARNPTLKRLWVIDGQHKPKDPPNTWAAWIRRDFKTKTSHPIPFGRIGGFCHDAYMARLPRSDGAPGTEDLLSFSWALETLTEGSAWRETPTGVRLPKPVMMARGYEWLAPELTKAQFRAGNNLTCMLWTNEEATGHRLLPEDPGTLMKAWDLQERTPSGWKRDDVQSAPMVEQ